jgi:hypothetical protein
MGFGNIGGMRVKFSSFNDYSGHLKLFLGISCFLKWKFCKYGKKSFWSQGAESATRYYCWSIAFPPVARVSVSRIGNDYKPALASGAFKIAAKTSNICPRETDSWVCCAMRSNLKSVFRSSPCARIRCTQLIASPCCQANISRDFDDKASGLGRRGGHPVPSTFHHLSSSSTQVVTKSKWN